MGAAPIGIPAEGFAAFVLRLRELGMTDAELDRRAGGRNPAALLGTPVGDDPFYGAVDLSQPARPVCL